MASRVHFQTAGLCSDAAAGQWWFQRGPPSRAWAPAASANDRLPCPATSTEPGQQSHAPQIWMALDRCLWEVKVSMHTFHPNSNSSGFKNATNISQGQRLNTLEASTSPSDGTRLCFKHDEAKLSLQSSRVSSKKNQANIHQILQFTASSCSSSSMELQSHR